MNTANKTTSTINPCPDCPSGSEGGVGVSLSDTALNNIINTLQLGTADKVMLTWLKLEATPAELLAMDKFLEDNVNSEETHAFLREAINALMNNGEVDWVDKIIIDSTFKNTKAECIYNKLNALSTKFSDAIKKFDGEFPVSHLKMSVDNNLPDSVNAITSNSGTYIIEIKINGNTLQNRTVLELARTLIHETIHAEMYRKLRSVNYSVSINDFLGIFYYYSTYKNWQHQQMASNYRTTIVDMLKEFDNNQHTESFYSDLAWEGLQGTVAWNELSSNEKTRIIKAVKDYKNNGNKNCN
ncbi:MAG: hypothetical protein GW847_01080 [Zetaproteobacteria bacterium]|nr:hypothetical protein [Zetaproteobacteria bacterium]OIO12387.1 MAG: hypothetical protein AUJ53_02445 [Flavobacteriaceae bacterium CG1_02_35_72]